MDYSLLNKFRGAWLGSMIATQVQVKAITNRKNQNQPDEIREQQPAIYLAQEQLFELAQRQWRSLNNLRDVNSQDETQQPELSQSKSTAHNLALLSLPIILYYHDNWSYLASFLHSQIEKSRLPSTNKNFLLIWAYAIRLGLRGELNLQNLTQQILTGTKITNSSVHQSLLALESSCQRGNNSQNLLNNHSDTSELIIILSLFYFLNNEDNFNLSTQQGLHQKKDYYSYVISKTEDIMGGWSGSNFAKETKAPMNIVTSTGVLQPRNNLKIISQ